MTNNTVPKRYRLLKDLPWVKAGAIYTRESENHSYYNTNGAEHRKRLPISFMNNEDLFEEILPCEYCGGIGEQLPGCIAYRREGGEFVRGFDPVRGRFEWADELKSAVVFKSDDKGEYLVHYTNRPESETDFKIEVQRLSQYYGSNILCEECKEIGRHKETCSQSHGASPVQEEKHTMSNDDLVGLLRDCVSQTWGNQSFDETQKLFDKFLREKKLIKPTLKELNEFITKGVNEILLGKKPQSTSPSPVQVEKYYFTQDGKSLRVGDDYWVIHRDDPMNIWSGIILVNEEWNGRSKYFSTESAAKEYMNPQPENKKPTSQSPTPDISKSKDHSVLEQARLRDKFLHRTYNPKP